MSKQRKGFTPADKSRITQAETVKHGHILKGGLGATVQRIVDTRTPAPAPAPTAPKK